MTIDFTTSAGYVRLLIGDTDESSPIFTDAEISAVISRTTSVYLAAADCCLAIAASAARSAIAFSVLGKELSVDKKSIPDHFRKLAAEFKERSEQDGSAFDYNRIEWPVKINQVDGRDESDYESDDDAEYFDTHYYEEE